MGGEGGQAGVSNQHTLVQVQAGQREAALGQGLHSVLLNTMNIFENIFHHLEAGISEVVEAGALEGDQVPAVAGEGDEGLVSEGDTVGDAEVPGDHRLLASIIVTFDGTP